MVPATSRVAIATAIVDLLSTIHPSNGYSSELDKSSVKLGMEFWDSIKEFPAIRLVPGLEEITYIPGGLKERLLTIPIYIYVDSENTLESLEALLADVELILERNSGLAYATAWDASNPIKHVQDILVRSIDTDQGALAPLGVGEMAIQVKY